MIKKDSRRTDRIVFQHAQRPMCSRSYHRLVISRQRHRDEAHGDRARFDCWKLISIALEIVLKMRQKSITFLRHCGETVLRIEVASQELKSSFASLSKPCLLASRAVNGILQYRKHGFQSSYPSEILFSRIFNRQKIPVRLVLKSIQGWYRRLHASLNPFCAQYFVQLPQSSSDHWRLLQVAPPILPEVIQMKVSSRDLLLL